MKNKFLFLLLGLLGFASCSDKEDEPERELCMYGVPTAYFTVKGRVTDPAGRPIQGIRVTPLAAWHRYEPNPNFIPDREVETDSLASGPIYTPEAGSFEISNSCFDWNDFHVTLRFEDVDGNQNGGLFKAKDAEVGITQGDRTEASSWTSIYTKQAADIVLEKEE